MLPLEYGKSILMLLIVIVTGIQGQGRPSFAGSGQHSGYKDRLKPETNSTEPEDLFNRIGQDLLSNRTQRPPVFVNVVLPDPQYTPILGERFGENGTLSFNILNTNSIQSQIPNLESTTRLPIDAFGNKDIVDRLNRLPFNQRPFWLINAQAIEKHRNQSESQLGNITNLQSLGSFAGSNSQTNQANTINNPLIMQSLQNEENLIAIERRNESDLINRIFLESSDNTTTNSVNITVSLVSTTANLANTTDNLVSTTANSVSTTSNPVNISTSSVSTPASSVSTTASSIDTTISPNLLTVQSGAVSGESLIDIETLIDVNTNINPVSTTNNLLNTTTSSTSTTTLPVSTTASSVNTTTSSVSTAAGSVSTTISPNFSTIQSGTVSGESLTDIETLIDIDDSTTEETATDIIEMSTIKPNSAGFPNYGKIKT